MASLADIFRKFKCDKYSTHRLDVFYEHILESRREKPLTLLEIGVRHGASLRSWYEYLPQVIIAAIDKNPECEQYTNDRTSIFIGNQSDKALLARVVEHTGPLDIVIDDASHKQIDQQASFRTLWPHVKQGGVYVIEDLHFHEKYNRAGAILTMDWLTALHRSTMRYKRGCVVPYWFGFYQAHCAIFKPPNT
jgi:cephalosporin hydroxylase